MSIALALCVSHPVKAQMALSAAECRDARAVALATLKKFRGRISAPLAASFARFSETCDMATKFETTPGSKDDQAFAEFRVKVAALRALR